MQEFVGFVVLMVAGAIAAMTKEFDSVMYTSVAVFALILFLLDLKRKKPKEKIEDSAEKENMKTEKKPKGLTTGLFTNFQ